MNRPNHALDGQRVQRERWPFNWTVPAPGCAAEGPGWPHSHSTQVHRRLQEGYAAQAELYAQAVVRVYRRPTGGTPDLIIMNEISDGIGTYLHADFERYHLGQEWP